MQTYLTHKQRSELTQDRAYFEKQLSRDDVQDKGSVRRELSRAVNLLETQSPPNLSGPDLDKAVRREAELREEITSNMLSQEEMRKSPPGSVGRNIEFERRHKEKILEWKNLRRTIHRDSDDPDVSNLEVFRPHRRPTDPSMQGALIEGQAFSFPSEKFKQNYDETFGVSEEQVAGLMSRLDDALERLAKLEGQDAAEEPDPPEEFEHEPDPDQTAAPTQVEPEKPKARTGRKWTEEQRKEASERELARVAALRAEAEGDTA